MFGQEFVYPDIKKTLETIFSLVQLYRTQMLAPVLEIQNNRQKSRMNESCLVHNGFLTGPLNGYGSKPIKSFEV